MEFGEIPVADALGAVMAHSLPVEGGRVRKGAVLAAADLRALQEAGHRTVWIARPGPGDVGEDAAARAMAEAMVPDPDGQFLRIGAAGTGRVNLFATAPGIVGVETGAIRGANAVDPMITVATVPPWHRLDAGGMAATIKIIAYAVPEAALRTACGAAAQALSLRRVTRPCVALIETETGAPVSDKGRRAVEARLVRLGAGLSAYRVVPHRTDDLAAALRETRADAILILTASATSDARDTAPAALRAAGGRLDRFGMPVDPGNLLFTGDLGGVPVVGLPGCARSVALNGADWVLERLLCGVEVTSDAIAAMGVGGLLKEMPGRPSPRRGRRTPPEDVAAT